MNTTRPDAARSAGSSACVTATCPTTLTSSWRRSSPRSSASTTPPMAIPALLTSASRRSPAASAAPSMESGSVTSRRMIRRRPEAAAPRRRPASSSRTPAMTSWPARSRARALARPMPREAPVIRTDVMRASLPYRSGLPGQPATGAGGGAPRSIATIAPRLCAGRRLACRWTTRRIGSVALRAAGGDADPRPRSSRVVGRLGWIDDARCRRTCPAGERARSAPRTSS